MSILSKDKSKSLVIKKKKNTTFSDYLFNQNLKDEVFEQKTEFLSDEQLQKDENFGKKTEKHHFLNQKEHLCNDG